MESQIPSPKTFRISGYHQGSLKTERSQKIIIRLFPFLFIILFISSCKKDSSVGKPPPPPPQLTITGEKPLTGKQGDTIIITGTNFNLNPAKDTVKFNGIPAQVQQAKADTLFVIVPAGNTTGAITVNGVTAPGPVFTGITALTNITITGVKPAYGKQGDTIIITGTNFNLNPSADTVKINGVIAVVQKASADTLYVIVPITNTGIITVNGVQAPGPAFIYNPAIVVTTFAGSGGINGAFADGPDSLAKFNSPIGICFDKQGNLYVADAGNYCIREISSGLVSTFAGNRMRGYLTGPNLLAEFADLSGMAIDAQDNIYILENLPSRVQKISAGMVSNYAGSGIRISANGQDTLASFFDPTKMTFDIQGNLYVGETGAIRKISTSGMVSTFAGKVVTHGIIDSASGRTGFISGVGYKDGQDTAARFGYIGSMTSDANGNIYVGDLGCACIRKVDPSGLVTTFAFLNGQPGIILPLPVNSILQGICLDAAGNVYTTQTSSILKITPNGVVSTLAGTDTPGYTDGPAGIAQFNFPMALAFDAQGNLYVADEGNQRIRKITFH